jgi:hypothetical protein
VTDFLKGNFDVKRAPKAEKVQEDLTDRFEQEALKHLGGSIAFVSKKKFVFGAGSASQAPTADAKPATAPDAPSGQTKK